MSSHYIDGHLSVYFVGQMQATAKFDGKGIKGYINFSEVPEGIRIQTSLQGLDGKVIRLLNVLQYYGLVHVLLESSGIYRAN